MHMSDALVSPAVAGTMYACSALMAGYSVRKVQTDENQDKIAVMGTMGAFVFAAQMINFTIPGTGSSGHLCGGVLLSAILGPYAAFLTMVGVLFIQCLMFADGGLLAFGCNVWNMAAYGCFIGGFLIWKQIMKKGICKKKIIIASIAASIIALQMGAFSVTLETLASGITNLPFGLFVATMQPIHLAIGLVEGVITSAVLIFIYNARPEMIWTGYRRDNSENEMSLKKLMLIIFIIALVIGGLLSVFASAYPDGLEWSISKITGGTELAASGVIHKLMRNIQEITAILPDYSFKSMGVAGTVLSGISGCVIICCIFNLFRKNKKHE